MPARHVGTPGGPRIAGWLASVALLVVVILVVVIMVTSRRGDTGQARPPTSTAAAPASGSSATTGSSAPSSGASSSAGPSTRAPTTGPPGGSSGGSSSPAATSSAAVSAAPSITLAFTGDMLPSEELQAQALRDGGGHRYDFRPMLSTVASILRSADWAICHQETPISDNDRGLSGYPDFNAPHELAAAERWAGYDACDTASNHTVDLGAAGVTATLDALDAVHIAHTGSARSPAEAAKPAIYDVKGVKVGHIAYTYGLNGNADPHPWTVNLIDIARIKAAARALKVAGADIVVVSVHAGIELDQSPSAYQVQIDDEIMSSPDVDLIVGAHAHVVQPIRRLADGRWIVYGVGNLLAQQAVPSNDPTPPHRDGVIVEATISRHNGTYRISRMGYVPTFVDAPSDKVELAPPFSRRRTVTALTAMRAPLVDLTPR